MQPNPYLQIGRYLNISDYFTIQSVQLNQLIQNNQARLLKSELLAIEEATSYLIQRFETDEEFQGTNPWSPFNVYYPSNRVILDYPTWIPNQTYAQYSCVTYNGSAYMAKTSVPISSPSGFYYSDWTLLGNQYEIFYASDPIINGNYIPEFNINCNYIVGNQVFWEGFIWTAITSTTVWNGMNIQQFFYYSDIPQKNVFPGSKMNANSSQQWANPTPYYIPEYAYGSPNGSLPGDTQYWVSSDNRSQQLVNCVMDLAIYYLHRSIAPDNIPKLRIEAYQQSKRWLEKVAQGEVTAKLPAKQPNQGFIHYGDSRIKQNNAY